MMRLHEAIRLGAVIRPQAFGRLFSDGGSCAMGGVLEAAGIFSYDPNLCAGGETTRKAYETFPILAKTCGFPKEAKKIFVYSPLTVWNAIAWLNNEPNCWTRERIADWVETIEAAEELRQQKSPAELVAK